MTQTDTGVSVPVLLTDAAQRGNAPLAADSEKDMALLFLCSLPSFQSALICVLAHACMSVRPESDVIAR